LENMKLSKRIRFGRISYLTLAIIFAVCTIIQIFIAGLAIFVNPVNWTKHFLFVHLFGFNTPLFMLVMAFIGRMPRWAYWQIFGLLVCIFSMYFTANSRGAFPWAGAAHPVIATLLFILSLTIVIKTWHLIFKKSSEKEK
jgi:Family of unknown function (DUF6220)